MGQFLQIIVNLIREYAVPWRAVYAGQRGIRWTFGKWTRDLAPGFWFYAPIIQHIETTWACYQEVDTALQTFTTRDNISVSLSANVGYTVYNAATYYTKVYNFDQTIERAIRGHLFEILHALEYEEIRTSLPALSQVLRDKIHAQATTWGVRIHHVRMTDFVRTRAYRILNEVPNFVISQAASA